MPFETDPDFTVIHGLGVEGLSALRWWQDEFRKPVLLIDTPDKISSSQTLSQPDVQLISEQSFLENPPTLPDKCIYLRSPGIPPSNPVYKVLGAQNIPTTTPTGFWLHRNTDRPVVTITGTKGKSSTASLVAHILRWAGKDAVELGNIGATPFEASLSSDTICVFELSSYMMHDLPMTGNFHTVLNLYKEHTAWHGSIDAYHSAKLRPFIEAPDAPGITSATIVDQLPGEHPTLSIFESIAVIEGNSIRLTSNDQLLASHQLNQRFSTQSMQLALRAAMAICIASGLLLPDEVVAAVTTYLAKWNGLPSRQEIIPSTDEKIWIDDALATVPEATLTALEQWQKQRIHLLLGGEDRGQNFLHLISTCTTMKEVVLYIFGETTTEILDTIKTNQLNCSPLSFQAFEDAICAANDASEAGDVILFSPSAPSEKIHGNFKNRSRIFQSFIPQN